MCGRWKNYYRCIIDLLISYHYRIYTLFIKENYLWKIFKACVIIILLLSPSSSSSLLSLLLFTKISQIYLKFSELALRLGDAYLRKVHFTHERVIWEVSFGNGCTFPTFQTRLRHHSGILQRSFGICFYGNLRRATMTKLRR